MVSTRHHPKAYPPPTDSPSSSNAVATSPKTPSPASNALSPRRATASSAVWSHAPSNVTLLWFVVALPLVVWDCGYVLLRPHTFPGGWLHKPIWGPYGYYGTVDLNYGVASFYNKEGWTGAQGLVNVFETAAYLTYVAIIYLYAKPADGRRTRSASKKASGPAGALKVLLEPRVVPGQEGAIASLLLFGTLVCTLAKTVLYMLIEVYGDFSNLKHNSWWVLFWIFIIPNGAWLVFPSWAAVLTWQDIIQGLRIASGDRKRK